MKNLTQPFLTAALLLAFSGQAISEEAADAAVAKAESSGTPMVCDTPAGPIIPDGNVASEDELLAAQKAMKMFQTSLVGYRNCLYDLEQAVDMEAEGAAEEAAAILANYNASVDAEEKVAADFNTAVKAFKARQE